MSTIKPKWQMTEEDIKLHVSGVLLYARTGEDLISDFDYTIGGNRIGVKNLDLNKPFALIAKQLDRLASGL